MHIISSSGGAAADSGGAAIILIPLLDQALRNSTYFSVFGAHIGSIFIPCVGEKVSKFLAGILEVQNGEFQGVWFHNFVSVCHDLFTLPFVSSCGRCYCFICLNVDGGRIRDLHQPIIVIVQLIRIVLCLIVFVTFCQNS